MSTNNDKLIIRTAIDVNIGNIKVIAILDDSCTFNSVHETVYKRICEIDDTLTYDDVENKTIELHMSIDNRSVSAVFRVLPDLQADMILREEFVTVKTHVHRELKSFKQSSKDESVITAKADNCDNFRASSGGCGVSNKTKSLEKEEIESTASQEPSISSKNKKKRKRNKKSKKNNDNDPSGSTDSQSTGDSCPSKETNTSEKPEEIEEPSTFSNEKKKRTRRKKSKKNNNPSSGSTDSQLSDGSCASNETKSLEKEETENTGSQEELKKKRRKRTKKKKSKNINLSSALVVINLRFPPPPLTLSTSDSVKMFVVEQELWDIMTGEIIMYVAMYFPQLNVNIIRTEELVPWEKNPLEFHMAALHAAFSEAKKRGVTKLHVLSENEDSIVLMKNRPKKCERGRFKGRNSANHFTKLYAAYFDVNKFKSLKFEYVPEVDVEKHKEMIHAKNLIDKFIEDRRYN